MTWIWNGLRLPQLGRFWRCRRQRRLPMLDPRDSAPTGAATWGSTIDRPGLAAAGVHSDAPRG